MCSCYSSARNVGLNLTYDPSSLIWKDLGSNGIDLTLDLPAYWSTSENCLITNGKGALSNNSIEFDAKTMEVVFDVGTIQTDMQVCLFYFGTPIKNFKNTVILSRYQSENRNCVVGCFPKVSLYNDTEEIKTGKHIVQSVFVDAYGAQNNDILDSERQTNLLKTYNQFTSGFSSICSVGGMVRTIPNYEWKIPTISKIYAVRCYTDELSDAELQHNRIVDSALYGINLP